MIVLAVLLAAVIFAIDVFTPFDGAIAVLYIGVILLLAPLGRRAVVVAAALTVGLATFGFVFGHLDSASDAAMSRYMVSIVAIMITALLSIRDRASRTTLGEQARILELSHDTVVMRDENDIIIYWNDGAEQLYGWTKREAVGQSCRSLLKCEFPEDEVAAALGREGRWSGELVRIRRDGTRIVLASRWLRRRDPDGRPIGVIESSADLTERLKAETHRQASERRYRAIFDASGFAAWESDWSETMRDILREAPSGTRRRPWLLARHDLVQKAVGGATIRNANPAAMELFGASQRADLVGSNLQGRYLPESSEALGSIVLSLLDGATMAEAEVRLRRLDGRTADVVLRATVLPEGSDWSHMLVMAFDVTERNEARARFEQVSAELAHAARVSMLGQLAASIAHEVNQPLAAIVNYGKSARRWLARKDPAIEEAQECVEKMLANGTRAADVVARVRSLARNAAPQAEAIDIGVLVEDAIALVQREARAQGVALLTEGLDRVPPVFADRVQVQQVLMNLLMNAIQAMRDVNERPRTISISALPEGGAVRIGVADSGIGFPTECAGKVFQPFFTTKPDGMGMGLSICRSIIHNQGGEITAGNNAHAGATVAFTLPVSHAQPAESAEFIS